MTFGAASFAQVWEHREPHGRLPARMSRAEAELIAQYWIQSYLRRPANPDEARYWADRLQTSPPADALSALLASREYRDYAGGTARGLMRQLIADVGHHEATRFEIDERLRASAGRSAREIALRFLAEYPGNWWPGPAATPPRELEFFYLGQDWHHAPAPWRR
jgi:hypothetical protein